MKTTWLQSLTNKVIATPVAIALAAGAIRGQEAGPAFPAAPLLPAVHPEFPEPPPLPESVPVKPKASNFPPFIGKYLHRTPAQKQKELEREVKGLFFYMLRPKAYPYDTYKVFKRKLAELKKITDPKLYPPQFAKDYIKNQSICVSELTNELEALSENFSQDSDLDTLISTINSFRNLCRKDLETKYVNLCFELEVENYDGIFGPALEGLQTKISERLIKELNQLKESKNIDPSYLGKVQKITTSLANLYSLNDEHPTPKLFSILYPYVTVNYPREEYRDLNRFPLVEEDFKEEILPKISEPKPVLDGNQTRIKEFTNYNSSILKLNNVLNHSNASDTREKFLCSVDSQLTNFFIQAVVDPNQETRQKSLLNLKEQLLSFIPSLTEKDNYKHFMFLKGELDRSFNSDADYEDIYYRLIQTSYIVDSQLESFNATHINLNLELLNKAQQDLAKVIDGTASPATEAHLKEFLSDYLVEATAWDCEFENTVQSFTANLNSEKYPQSPKQNFWNNQSVIFQDLIRTVLTPDFSHIGLAKHPNPFIADAFNINKMIQGRKHTIEDLIEVNRRYLKAMNLFESAFLLAQSKINNPNLIDRLANLYYGIEKEIAQKFSRPYPFSEFPAMIDELTLGAVYGHYLESQFQSPPSLKASLYATGESCVIPSKIIKDRASKLGFTNSTDIEKNFPDRTRIQSRLNFKFLGEEPSSSNGFLNRDDQAFIIGALIAIPCHNANSLNLNNRLGPRFDKIISSRFSDNKHLITKEIKQHFIKVAIDLIEAENPGMITPEPEEAKITKNSNS